MMPKKTTSDEDPESSEGRVMNITEGLRTLLINGLGGLHQTFTKANPYNFLPNLPVWLRRSPRLTEDDYRVMDQKILAVVRECDVLEEEWPTYLSIVEMWLRHRRQTILALKEVANKLDKTHRNANIARSVGVGLAAAGIFAEIVGSIMAFNDCENATDVRKAARICGGIGIATSTVASRIEESLSIYEIRQLQIMLRKDQDMLQRIAPFYIRSERVDEALRDLFDIGLAPQFEVPGNIAILNILKMFKNHSVRIPDIVRALSNIGYDIESGDFRSFVDVTLPKLYNTFQDIFSDKRLRESLESMSHLLIQSSSVVGEAQLCINVLSSISGVDVTKMASRSVMSRLSISPELVPMCPTIAVTLAKSVAFAYKVISIIDTIEKVVNDAPSEYSKVLRNLSKQLDQELNQIGHHLIKRTSLKALK